MRDRIKRLLKSNCGEGYVNVCVFILCVLILFSVFYQYIQAIMVIKNIQNTSEQILNKHTVRTSIDIVESVKNGNDYTQIITSTILMDDMRTELGLDATGAFHKQYRITNTSLTFVMAERLDTKFKYTVDMPLTFYGIVITDIRVPITVVSRYTLK